MLGLQSHISLADNSNLSIQSNLHTASKQQNPSTNYDSHCDKDDLSPHLQLQSQHKSNTENKVRSLKNRLNQLQQLQQTMDYKMNGFIKVLQQELSNKQKANGEIQKTIQQLRREVQESRVDIETISSLLNKRTKGKMQKITENTIVNNGLNTHREIGKVNLPLNHVRSQNKIGSISPMSGRVFINKPVSPKLKTAHNHGRQFSHHDNLIMNHENLKTPIDGRKSTQIVGSSPLRKQKFLKSP